MSFRLAVSVAAIYRVDVVVIASTGGENLRLRLTGIEEDEIQAGFIICSRNVPVPCVTYFQAQLQVIAPPDYYDAASYCDPLLEQLDFGTAV